MPRPQPKKPADDESDDDVLMKTPSDVEDDWMEDEDEDPMEDNSLEIDEEESF